MARAIDSLRPALVGSIRPVTVTVTATVVVVVP